MSNEIIECVAGVANVVGTSVSERKLYAVQHACPIAAAALVGCGGAAGKEAQRRTAIEGLAKIAKQASHNNYESVAAYFSARMGASFTVSNRASFESLPDRMDDAVKAVKMGKAGGMKSDKNGVMVPGTKLALALDLYNVAVALTTEAAALFAQRMKEKNDRAGVSYTGFREVAKTGAAVV